MNRTNKKVETFESQAHLTKKSPSSPRASRPADVIVRANASDSSAIAQFFGISRPRSNETDTRDDP